MSNSKFNSAMLLSGFATLIFSLFFVFGSFFLLQPLLQPNEPPLFLGANTWVTQAIGGGVALFGMFGLLIARGLAVLIATEKSVRTLSVETVVQNGEAARPTAAYKFGQMVGKAMSSGEPRPDTGDRNER